MTVKLKKPKPGKRAPEPPVRYRDDVHVVVGGRAFFAREVRVQVGDLVITWSGSRERKVGTP